MSLTAEQKERLKVTFGYFDQNGDGTIDRKELKNTLKKLGNFSELDISSILNEADADKSGTIDFDEFSKFVAPRLLKVPPPATDIESAFKKYDKDSSGFIEANEIVSLAADLGFGKISMLQAKEMISIVDANNDGKINIDEFKKLVIN